MIYQLIEIFFNVITPVFALVIIGYVAGPKLGLQARTLSRYAYFILVPSFIFNVMSTAKMEANLAVRMVGYTLVVHLAIAGLAFVIARLLKRSVKMIGAYVVIAVFGNVGNFGLPIIEFRLGPEAITAATVYFLAIVVIAFVISVAAASWHQGGRLTAVLSVLKTPALLALIPALFFNLTAFTPPLFFARITGLLGSAMVPTMLVALGVQLAATKQMQISKDMLIATGVRLIGAPILAILLVIPFGLTGVERGAGIFQASMPTAVLASIIALEYDLLPDFVTTAVLFSTLASVVTLTLLLALV